MVHPAPGKGRLLPSDFYYYAQRDIDTVVRFYCLVAFYLSLASDFRPASVILSG